MLKALLLLVVGVPPLLCALFLPSYLPVMREAMDWRGHRDPYDFLLRWPAGRYQWMALAELDAAQRREGYIARLVTSKYGPRYLRGTEIWKAQWHPDGTQVLTGSATTAVRWDAAAGTPLATYGAARRRDAQDANKWGFGFSEVAWYQGGQSVVALTSGPHSLWFYPGPAREPLLLDGDGYEALTARGQRIALIRNLEHAVVLDASTGERLTLPHEEINTVALTADGGAVTASRVLLNSWRGNEKWRSVPIQASYNPLGFSDDGRWALVLAQRNVELWSTATGARLDLAHEVDATAVCASADTVATGTEDGYVYLWSSDDGRRLRRFRASTTRIDMLACAPTRLLTLSYNRTDARVWDPSGRPQSGPTITPAPPNHHLLVRWGVDLDLPARWPGVVNWFEEQDVNGLNPHAGAALLVLIGAAGWLARSSRKRQ